MSFTDAMAPNERALRMMEVLMALHPAYVEALIDTLDEMPDFHLWLCRVYEREWPQRALNFFHQVERIES